MNAVSYARPRLTTVEDKHYRAYVQQFILQRKNQRAIRPPRQRDIFGNQAEQALREWLAEHLTLSNRRILEYEERRGKRASIKYRELDALVLEDKRTIWVFEIKASRTARSLRKAVAQLQETRAILRLIYPNISTTVLLVDTGIPTEEEIAALMAEPDAPQEPPQTFEQVLESLEQVQLGNTLDTCNRANTGTDVLRFRVDDIIAIAGEEHLALDWSDDEIDMESGDHSQTTSVYSTADEDEVESNDGGALAEALRKAGLTG